MSGQVGGEYTRWHFLSTGRWPGVGIGGLSSLSAYTYIPQSDFCLEVYGFQCGFPLNRTECAWLMSVVVLFFFCVGVVDVWLHMKWLACSVAI